MDNNKVILQMKSLLFFRSFVIKFDKNPVRKVNKGAHTHKITSRLVPSSFMSISSHSHPIATVVIGSDFMGQLSDLITAAGATNQIES